MSRQHRLLLVAACWLALALPAAADFFQLDQTAVLFSTNYSRGVNLTAIPTNKLAFGLSFAGNKISPDGTIHQFQSVLSFGAVVRPSAATNGLIKNSTYEQNAAQIGLPNGTSAGKIVYVLRTSQVGGSTFSRAASFSFGSTITPPLTDENGNVLVRPDLYWQAQPYTPTNVTDPPYYWSPHARAVFATQPGPIQVTWIKAAADTNVLSSELNSSPPTAINVSGLTYRLKTVSYVVSGVAVKPPRKIYWTEKTFGATGKPVSVPTGRIGTVLIHYNSAFPQTTTNEFVALGQSSILDGSTNASLKELRTLWYDSDQNLILAYNLEGRVFLELLGDVTSPGVRTHLGFEIVDVIQQPSPVDLSADLGEKIRAFADGSSDAALTPSPVVSVVNGSFLYQSQADLNSRPDFYAVRESVNQNDVLVHWLESGVEDLLWPSIFGRYKQAWPTNLTHYSHYMRPLVSSDAEAQATAIPLPTDNAPAIQYQDPLDFPRGKLTASFAYYTFLDVAHPTHRGLLRFNANNQVAFERVLSTLTTSIVPVGLASSNTVDLALIPGANGSGRATFLNLDGSSGFGQIEAGVPLNTVGFTVESWVYLRSSPGVSRLFDFKVGSNSTNRVFLDLPLFEVNSLTVPSPVLKTVLATNFNGTKSVNGMKIGFDITIPANGGNSWAAISLGLSGTTALTVNDPASHFGVLFRDGGTLQAFDGNTVVSPSTEPVWSATPTATHHIDVVCSDPLDGNPFDGSGSTEIQVLVDGVSRFVFTKGSGGYANNSINLYNLSPSNLNPVARNFTISTTTNLFYNQWNHVALAGTGGGAGQVFLNGVLVATNLQPVVNSTITSGVIGGNLDTLTNGINMDAAIDDFRIWSNTRSASQIVADMNSTGYPFGTAGLAAQFGFEQAGSDQHDTSGNGVDLFLNGVAIVDNDQTQSAVPGTGVIDYSSSQLLVPRYVQANANVGDRITAPVFEVGGNPGDNYLAPYILQSTGTSFHPGDYIDPFQAGFAAAGLGAVIPVNAIPGQNVLEVWWFRQNSTNAGNSLLNSSAGFKPIFWPSVVARYNLVWPSYPTNDLVMAGNAGSGPLVSLQAKGSIYTQNDRTLAGYNPNEEHAVLVGGQAYALRDDLNITNGTNFSSLPYVLLDYTESDGRPAMRAFKVLREKPSAGIIFDYLVKAGTQVQAPMPLPFLSPPVELVTNSVDNSITAVNYNTEPSSATGDVPPGWVDTTDASGQFGNYKKFTFKDRKNAFWVMRGLHAGLPQLQAGFYSTNSLTFTTNVSVNVLTGGQFTNYIHTSRTIDTLNATVRGNGLPAGMFFGALPAGLAVYGTAPAGVNTFTLDITDGDGALATVVLTLTATNVDTTKPALTIVSSNQYTGSLSTYVGRPPQFASPATSSNCFTMQFYYTTQAGFAWPSFVPGTEPPVGSIVPYLRPAGSTADPSSKLTPSLSIVYRPVWPADAPVVAFGETLTVASKGRPDIRDQSSAQVLYQQSIALNFNAARTNDVSAVVLHDPTVQKSFALTSDPTMGLNELPAGVQTQGYQGKTYFPLLPPHLAQRFFFDPNLGANGSLVYKGEFKDEVLGDKYLLLNVLAGLDLTAVKGLCPASDPDKQNWDAAIDGLQVQVLTFYENPQVPGQYIVNTNFTVTRGVSDLVAIRPA